MTQYIMGVDAYKTHNSESYAIVVLKKSDDEMGFVAVYHSHNEMDYEKEIERLSKYYNIPEEKIFHEK